MQFEIKKNCSGFGVQFNSLQNQAEAGFPYIDGYLIAAQLVVLVVVDHLEHVGLGLLVADVDQLHLEDESGSTGNHLASSAVTVAERWRNGQLALLTCRILRTRKV